MPGLLGIVSPLLARVLAIPVCVRTCKTPADAGCTRVEFRGRNTDLALLRLALGRRSAPPESGWFRVPDCTAQRDSRNALVPAPTAGRRTLAGIDQTRRVALAR